MEKKIMRAVVLLGFMGFLGIASGQETARVEIQSVDVSEFPVNFIYYTVKDAEGKYLGPVWVDDVELYEDGVQQTLWSEEEERRFPASLVLILDSSGSMKQAMAGVLGAASSLIDMLDENDEAEIIDFDSSVRVVRQFTKDKGKLSGVLSSISSGGGTALYDAVAKGLDETRNKKGLKAVVLLTDGKDENARGDGPGSKIDLDKLEDRLKSAGIPVYAIGLGKGVDKPTLGDIASVSGGKVYYAEEADAVGKIYADIINYLHSLCRFYYASHNGRHDKTRRQIVLKLKNNESESKAYYFSPQAKYWSYAVSPHREYFIHHLAITPDGNYIAALNIPLVLNKDGVRKYARWGGTDTHDGVFSKEYLCLRSYGYLGGLYRFDGENIAEIESMAFLSSAGGNFHKDWEWYPKTISKNNQYIIFASRPEEQEFSYYFIVYSIPEKKVLWEKGLYSGEFDEPGGMAVAGNGTALITQDCNLFVIDRSGQGLIKWLWKETNKRFQRLAVTADGSKFMARVSDAEGDNNTVGVYDIKGKLLWSVKSVPNEKGGQIDLSSNGRYFALNDIYGPRVFDTNGKILFKDIQKQPVESDNSGNGIAVADNGILVYSIANRIYYHKIE